jgi:heme-degrading monooxygenase HmoA
MSCANEGADATPQGLIYTRLFYDRDMIVVSNRIPVTPGHEAEFEKRFENRARLVEKHPGFHSFQILRPTSVNMHGGKMGESAYYVVLTFWRTKEDFVSWTESDSFREAHSNRPPKEMFAGPNVFEMHEVIQRVDSKI